MSTLEETTPELTAMRLAKIVSVVMNLMATLRHEGTLRTADLIELRSSLLWTVDEMTWLATLAARGVVGGLLWPQDAGERIERLRVAAGAWDPVGPPPARVLSSASDCLQIIAPS